MLTRYWVQLTAGAELQVVRQNLEGDPEGEERRGPEITIGWRAEHMVPIAEERSTQ
jgi:hypothetical protein